MSALAVVNPPSDAGCYDNGEEVWRGGGRGSQTGRGFLFPAPRASLIPHLIVFVSVSGDRI